MTVQDLVNGVLATLMVYSPGETVAPEDYDITLTALNLLISSWNASVQKALSANYTPLIPLWNAAVQKSLAANYNNLIEAWNAAALKSLSAGYDPSLFTFHAMSTAALYTFNAITNTPVASFNAVAALVNPSDPITLPNGWTRALQYNAAIDVAPIFQRPVGDDIKAIAADAKSAILTPAGSDPAFGSIVEETLAMIPPASHSAGYSPVRSTPSKQ